MNNSTQVSTIAKIMLVAKVFAYVLLAFMEISIDKSYMTQMLSLLLFSGHGTELIHKHKVSHDVSETLF
jgi:hypothetical protein